MKKTTGVLAALCWLIFGITGVIRWTAGDSGLMTAEMLRNAPPEVTGLPEKDYPGVCAMTAEYLTGKRESFQYEVLQETGDGPAYSRTKVFQEHEAAHMADCRELIRLDTILCTVCGLAGLILTAAGLIPRKDRKVFLRGMLYGLCGFTGTAVILGIWALVNFNGLFVTFHKVAFRNDGWILNPRTDLLIRLMPTAFFIRLGIRGLLRFAALPAVMAIVLTAGLRRKKDSSLRQE